MAGLQSGEGRMMFDSVVWAQYVNVTDRQTDRQTRRDSNAEPKHCVWRQKSESRPIIRPHRKHEMRTIVIDDPGICQSECHVALLSKHS